MKIKLLLLTLLISVSVFSQKVHKLQEVTVYNVQKNDSYVVETIKFDSVQPLTNGDNQISYLRTLPSITYHSDIGVEAGYNYFRLRGIDQSKINMTLNGIPLNEPEDGGFYFNNLGGLVHILEDIQVVNGASLIKNGTSVYAGGINMNTKKITSNYIGLKSYVGYDNTNSTTITSSNTNKVLNSMFSIHQSNTDGYKYNAYNKTKNGSYILSKSINDKLYIETLGSITQQHNGMAWIGATKEQIKDNPRVNNNTKDEYDNFINYVSQYNIVYSSNGYVLQSNSYYNYLNGRYVTDLDNLIGEGGMYKNKLYQNWIGNSTNIRKTFNNLTSNLGIHGYYYRRNHIGVGEYSNIGRKREIAPYFNSSFNWKNFKFNGSIQWRVVQFRYDDNVPINNWKVTKDWQFLNFSTGVNYKFNDNFNAYYSFAKNNKEANRLDLFGGSDFFDLSLYQDLPSEYVLDHEIGIRFNKGKFNVELPFYYMSFKNELALNGLMNQQGIHLHSTSESSKRYGMEYKLSYVDKLSIYLNGNISSNQISDYYHILSPKFSTNLMFDYKLNKHIGVNILGKFIGKQYIDMLNEYELSEQYTIDLGTTYTLNDLNVSLSLVNLTNKLNYTNAYMNGDVPYYFNNSGFRINLGVSYKFKY